MFYLFFIKGGELTGTLPLSGLHLKKFVCSFILVGYTNSMENTFVLGSSCHRSLCVRLILKPKLRA